MIAFFGTGLLGSGFVRALRRRGEEVRVWNRTAEKAKALEADGAKAFATPAEAARGAVRIHMSLSDDEAVEDVLAKAAPSANTIIVDHTTTSTAGTLARVQRLPTFVHAPVFMGPQNTLESTGTMLVSGARDRVTPELSEQLAKMTGKLVDLGDRPDAAAAFKLLGNLFLMFLTSGFADFFALGRAMDVDPKTCATLFENFNPGLTLPARIGRMLAADWGNPSWELAMARKDARLMLEESERGNQPLAILPTIAARMDQLIAEGHGKDDWTVLGRDALQTH